jgi:hypothetical protein
MNTGEVKLRDAGARQRGQDARAARSALVEPGDEGIHLGFHPRRGRGLEVNLAVVKAAGYDALGLVCSITADYFDAPFAAHHHLVPLEHRLVRERRGESFVEIDHHFRDAAFGGGILRWSPPSLNCWRSDDCTLSRFSTSPSISEVFGAPSGGSSTASPISRAETPSPSIRSNSSSRAIPTKRRASAAC